MQLSSSDHGSLCYYMYMNSIFCYGSLRLLFTCIGVIRSSTRALARVMAAPILFMASLATSHVISWVVERSIILIAAKEVPLAWNVVNAQVYGI